MTLTERRTRYRNVLAGVECIHPTSVFDPISARMAEAAGFEIGIAGWFNRLGHRPGRPRHHGSDLDRVCRADPPHHLCRFPESDGRRRVWLRRALNVMRTVGELEAARVSALTIEDMLLPPRFGQKQREKLIASEEGVRSCNIAGFIGLASISGMVTRMTRGVGSPGDLGGHTHKVTDSI
jgi:oxaloacetate decarboxylase